MDSSRYKATHITDSDVSLVDSISSSSPDFYSERQFSQSNRKNKARNTERIHLPPIHHHQEYSYEPAYHHLEHVHYPYVNHYEHYYHRRHNKHGETYDPRWWYMPLYSVHGPRLQHRTADHYVAPKWYELHARQSIIRR